MHQVRQALDTIVRTVHTYKLAPSGIIDFGSVLDMEQLKHTFNRGDSKTPTSSPHVKVR